MDFPSGFQNVWNSALGGRSMTPQEESLWADWFAQNGSGQDGLGGSADWVDMVWGSPEAASYASTQGADYSKPALQQDTMQARNTQLAQDYMGLGGSPAMSTPIDLGQMMDTAAQDIAAGQARQQQQSAYDPSAPYRGGSHTVRGPNGEQIQLVPGAEGFNAATAQPYLDQIGQSLGYGGYDDYMANYRNPANFMPGFDYSKLGDAQQMYNQSAGFGGTGGVGGGSGGPGAGGGGSSPNPVQGGGGGGGTQTQTPNWQSILDQWSNTQQNLFDQQNAAWGQQFADQQQAHSDLMSGWMDMFNNNLNNSNQTYNATNWITPYNQSPTYDPVYQANSNGNPANGYAPSWGQSNPFNIRTF